MTFNKGNSDLAITYPTERTFCKFKDFQLDFFSFNEVLNIFLEEATLRTDENEKNSRYLHFMY